MKKALLLCCLWTVLSMNFCASAQVFRNAKSHADSSYFDRMLCEYQIDSCLFNLLEAVVDADSSHMDYSPNVFFYSLTFQNNKSSRYINISPRLWDNSKYLDYSGVVRIKDMIFLCRGDFKKDSIFHKSISNKKRIRLKQFASSFRKSFFEDPSLQGAFKDCKGSLINVEIYIKGKILVHEVKP